MSGFPHLSALAGKVAVVTGGASGIGTAVVERLAAEGATVGADHELAAVASLGI